MAHERLSRYGQAIEHIGYTAEQRGQRDRVAKVVKPVAPRNKDEALALGKVAGRVFLVPLDMQDGAWLERERGVDRELDRIERHVGQSSAGVGCTLALLAAIGIVGGLEWRWFDTLFGAELGEMRHWATYGLILAILLALWTLYDYLAQWRRYLKLRPYLDELMQTNQFTPHELLARTVRPARVIERTLAHFVAHDEAWCGTSLRHAVEPPPRKPSAPRGQP